MKGLIAVAVLVLGTSACGVSVIGHAVPQPTESMRQWQATGSQYNGLGVWTYENELVLATNQSVTAYDRASGQVLWQTMSPGNGSDFCGASTTIANGVVSLGYGAQGSNPAGIACEYVTVLDLNTGKLGWSVHVPNATELAKLMHANGLITEVSGQTVVVGWTGVVAGYDIATGKQRYRSLIDPNGDYSPFDVKDIAIIGDTADFLVHTSVPLGAGMTPVSVFALDVATGQEVARVHVDTTAFGFDQPAAGGFVSTSPLMALVYDNGTGSDARYITFDSRLTKVTSAVDAGRQLDANSNPVPSSLESGLFDTGTNSDSHQVYRTLIANGSLFSVTLPGAGNQVVDVDIATGQRRWAASLPGMTMLMPVALDGPTLVVAAIGEATDAPITVVGIDASSGRIVSRRTGSVPMDAPVAITFWFLWADHRVYGVNWGMDNPANKVVALAVG